MGRPWEQLDHKDGPRHWFVLENLLKHLRRENHDKYRSWSANKLGRFIRKLGGSRQSLRVGNETPGMFWVPSAEVPPRAEVEPPKSPKVEPF